MRSGSAWCWASTSPAAPPCAWPCAAGGDGDGDGGGTACCAMLSPSPCSERCGGAYAALLDLMRAKLGREEDGARGGECQLGGLWGVWGGTGEFMGRMLGGRWGVIREDAGGMHEGCWRISGMQRGCRRDAAGCRRDTGGVSGGCWDDAGRMRGDIERIQGRCWEDAGQMFMDIRGIQEGCWGTPVPSAAPVGTSGEGHPPECCLPVPRSRRGADPGTRMGVQPHTNGGATVPRPSRARWPGGERRERLPQAAEVLGEKGGGVMPGQG